MNGWELREHRRQSGLTLSQVARATGTSVPNVSAYERGTKAPSRATLDRLIAVIDAGSDSPIHRAALLTVPAAAAAIRHDLRERSASVGQTLRLVREMVNNAAFVAERAVDARAFFAKPSTTGDQRWDALLAGVTEVLCRQQGTIDVPAWTARRSVRPFWFVGETRGLHAYAFAHSPGPLASRGVFIDPADLTSV